MLEKLFSTTLGRVLSALILFIIGFFSSIITTYWESNVASPDFVEQTVEREVEAVRIELKLEDQDIQRDFLDLKKEQNIVDTKMAVAIENQTIAINKLSADQLKFQVKMSAEVGHLGEKLDGATEELKEVKNRLRLVEQGD
jgi:hypothetical protein